MLKSTKRGKHANVKSLNSSKTIIVLTLVILSVLFCCFAVAKYVKKLENTVTLNFREIISEIEVDKGAMLENGYVKVTILTQDELNIQYKVDNGEWLDYTSELQITEDCTIYARLTDGTATYPEVSEVIEIPVAQTEIGSIVTYHTSLQSAIDIVGSSEAKISMLKDYTADSAEFTEGQDITLDLNEKTITLSGISLTNDGTLEITGENGKIISDIDTIVNNGTLTVGNGAQIDCTAVDTYNAIKNLGEANVNDCIINSTYRGIRNEGNGKIIVDGAEIETVSSGILNISNKNSIIDSSVKVVSGEIISNSSNAISNSRIGLIHILDGDMISNGATTPTIINSKEGTIIIENGNITAVGTNGVVHNGYNSGNGNGIIKIMGGTITGESGTGVISREKGTIIITGGTISGQYGARATESGKLIIGTKEEVGQVIEQPTITGEIYGLYREGTSEIYFYDGTIIGPVDNSIKGEIEEIQPGGYIINKRVENNKEIARLLVANYESISESTLADVVEVGDYVNYDASSNGVQTFTTEDCLTGTSISGTISTENAFNSDAPAQWRVLSVDRENGIVELMAADPTAQTVTLSGGDGFVNAETILNSIGEIYGHGEGAESGRSITLEDVEQYSSYDPYTYENENSSTGYYGGTKDYTSGTFYKEVTDNEGNVIGYEDTTTAASASSPVTMTQTYYGYTASSYFSNSTIYNMIFKNSTSTSSDKSTYWLASRCVYLYSSDCSFSVRRVYSGNVYNNVVYHSIGSTSSPANRVLPVVTLNTNIQTTGKDANGVWQLNTEELTLADVVEVGDYVNYDANSKGARSFTSSYCLAGTSISGTISTENAFNSDAPAQWRVLSVDRETGIVELMAADPTAQTVTLSGGDGFVNAETILNSIGEIYGHGEGAESGRSITVEDVEQYSSYDPYTFENSNSSTGYYGGTREYTSGNFYKEVTDNEGNVIGYEDTTTAASASSPVTMTQTSYYYTASSYFSNSTIYNMIFNKSTSTSSNKSTYWLASRCVNQGSSYCSFNVRYVNSGGVYFNYVYYSYGITSSPAYSVVPVVKLKTNIKTIGKENDVWQLKIEKEPEYYLTLSDAIANSADGSTIKVISNVIETEAPEIPEGKAIVLDLNGQTVTLNSVSLTNNGTLTITDNLGNGTLTCNPSNSATVVNNGKLYTTGNQEFTIDNMTTVAIRTIMNNENAIAELSAGTITNSNPNIELDSSNTDFSAGYRCIIENNGELQLLGANIIAKTDISNITDENEKKTIAGKQRGILSNTTGKIVMKSGKIDVNGVAIRNLSTLSEETNPSIKIVGGEIISLFNSIVNKSTGMIIVDGTAQITAKQTFGNTPTLYNDIGIILIKGGTIVAEKDRAVCNYAQGGIVKMTGGTVKGVRAIYNSISTSIEGIDRNTEVIITGGTVIGTEYAIYNHSYSESAIITIGVNEAEPIVSKEVPEIYGAEKGVWNYGGTVNFYDGKITGTAENSIVGTVTEKPTGYEIQKIQQEDSEGTIIEIATLVKPNYMSTTHSTLADVVEVGDYVNYDASSNGAYTFTAGDCLTGTSISDTISTENDFNSDAVAQWRVLSVDRENGIVELMAADPTAQTVTLSGGDGFVNAEDVLNNIGAIYGHGKGAESGRSITVEDVEQYSSYDPYTYANSNSSTGYYGGIRDYTSGNFYKEIKDEEGNVTGYEETTTAASSTSPITMTQTYYYSTARNYFSNTTIYNMIFKDSVSTSSNKSNYWLASRCVNLFSDYCSFGARRVLSGNVSGYSLYNSNGYENSPSYACTPVVTLNTNIQTTGRENGVWQLKLEETTAKTTYFDTLESAFNYAEDGSTIKVLNTDLTETTQPVVSDNKTVVLDLNGKTVNLNGVSIKNESGTALRVTDSVGNGILSGTGGVINTSGIFETFGNNEFTIESTSTVRSTRILYIGVGATAILNVGIIQYANAIVESGTSGRYLVDLRGLLTINGATLQAVVGNDNYDRGILLYSETARLIVKSGTIQTDGFAINVALATGATIGDAAVTITGGNIISNKNYGVYNQKAGLIYMNGGNIIGTFGIFNNSIGNIKVGGTANITVSDTGIRGYTGTTLITGGTIEAENVGVSCTTGPITITGGNIIAKTGVLNNSTGNIQVGGTAKITTTTDAGIRVYAGTALITGGTIEATNHGVTCSTGSVTITGGTISGGTETKSASGIYVSDAGTITIGTNEETPSVKTDSPSITGSTNGVNIPSLATFNFYDGIIKGTTIAILGIVDNMPTGYTLLMGTDGNYKTATLTNDFDNNYEEVTSSGTHVNYYGSLAAAFSNTASGNTVKVVENNITETVKPILPTSKNIKLDLSGKTVTMQNLISVLSGGTLQVVDTAGNGTLQRLDHYLFVNNGTLKIGTQGDTSTTSPKLYGRLDNYSNLEIYSGLVSSNTVYTISNNKNVTIAGGLITNTYSGTSGTYTIINGNRDTTNGTSNVVTNLTITGGEIQGAKNNTTYAITTSHSYTNGYINISGGTITNQILNRKGETIISGGTINSLVQTYTGSIEFTEGTINSSTYGLYATTGTITIGTKDGTVSTTSPSITAATYGVQVEEGGIINFYDGVIKGKTAAITGGTVTPEDGYSVNTVTSGDYQVATLIAGTSTSSLIVDDDELQKEEIVESNEIETEDKSIIELEDEIIEENNTTEVVLFNESTKEKILNEEQENKTVE